MSQVKSSIDASGEIDYGNIDNLEQNSSGFSFEGDFGSVEIIGGELSFKIKET